MTVRLARPGPLSDHVLTAPVEGTCRRLRHGATAPARRLRRWPANPARRARCRDMWPPAGTGQATRPKAGDPGASCPVGPREAGLGM
jgi:hypothetical protein